MHEPPTGANAEGKGNVPRSQPRPGFLLQMAARPVKGFSEQEVQHDREASAMKPGGEPGVGLEEDRADHAQSCREGEHEPERHADARKVVARLKTDGFQGRGGVGAEPADDSPHDLPCSAESLPIVARACHWGKYEKTLARASRRGRTKRERRYSAPIPVKTAILQDRRLEPLFELCPLDAATEVLIGSSLLLTAAAIRIDASSVYESTLQGNGPWRQGVLRPLLLRNSGGACFVPSSPSGLPAPLERQPERRRSLGGGELQPFAPGEGAEQNFPVFPAPDLGARDQGEPLQDLPDLHHHLERRSGLRPEEIGRASCRERV